MAEIKRDRNTSSTNATNVQIALLVDVVKPKLLIYLLSVRTKVADSMP